MTRSLEPVAFDIETTGFQIDDRVTVAGFRLPLGVAVVLNSDERAVDREDLERRLEGETGTNVRLYVGGDERRLLEHVHGIVEEYVGDEKMLVAFNAETWNGGFDLPFLRTRVSNYEMEWPFDGLAYADMMPVFNHRINTVVNEDGEEAASLDDLYDAVIGAGHCDPFDSSAEAVDAWEVGDFERLLLHNIADINRTQALAEYANRVVPRSDFSLKNLTPP